MSWKGAGSPKRGLHARAPVAPSPQHPGAGASCWDTEGLGWGVWKNYSICKTLAMASLLVRALILALAFTLHPLEPPWGLVVGGDSFSLRPALLRGKVPAPAKLGILLPCFCAPSRHHGLPGARRVAYGSSHALSCTTAQIWEKWVSKGLRCAGSSLLGFSSWEAWCPLPARAACGSLWGGGDGRRTANSRLIASSMTVYMNI